jgi:hypothetical protein
MTERSFTACNVLVSYPYCSRQVLDGIEAWGNGMRWLLDCGAYTALQAGKAVDLDSYIAFCHRVKPWGYFSLDVIGDPDTTHANYAVMRDAGLKPIPILTIGEGPETVDRYYPDAEFVAIAGINGKDGTRSTLRVAQMIEALPDRRLHLLGFTQPEQLIYFHPYSCDSSSWMITNRFGRLAVYTGKGRYVVLQRKDFYSKPSAKLLGRIRAMGIDPADLAVESAWHGEKGLAARLTARTWVRMSAEMEQHLDTRLFLAAPHAGYLRNLREAWEWQWNNAA